MTRVVSLEKGQRGRDEVKRQEYHRQGLCISGMVEGAKEVMEAKLA